MTNLSKNSNLDNNPLPVSTKNLIRFLVLLIIAIAFYAGYYHSLYTLEKRKYNRLEDMYVRVRLMIGREEMQRLIDESYELVDSSGSLSKNELERIELFEDGLATESAEIINNQE